MISTFLLAAVVSQPLSVVVQSGHAADVRSLAFLDGGALASASEDGVIVWDADRAWAYAVVRGGQGCTAAGGRRAVVMSAGTARVVALPDGSTVRELAIPADACCARLDEAGAVLAVESGPNVLAFEVETGKRTASVRGRLAGITPDGTSLLVIDRERAAIHAVRGGKRIRAVAAKGEALAFDASGTHLAVFWNGAVVVVETKTGKVAGKVPAPWFPARIELAPEGTTLARIVTERYRDLGVRETVDLYDVASGKRRAQLSTPDAHLMRDAAKQGREMRQPIGAITFGAGLVATAHRRTLRVWDLETGALRRTISAEHSAASAVAFAAGAPILARAGATALVFDLALGLPRCELGDHEGGVESIAMSNDASLIATAGRSNYPIRTYHGAACTPGPTLAGRDVVAISGDGKLLAAHYGDRRVVVHELASGRQAHLFAGHSDLVTALAFDRAGSRLASGGSWKDGSVRVWSLAGGRELFRAETGVVTSLTFSPDGGALAVAAARKVFVLDAATGKVRWSHELRSGAAGGVAFTPRGDRLAFGSMSVMTWGGGGRVFLADAATGQVLRETTADALSVLALAFDGTGKRLAAGGREGAVRFLDAETLEEVAALHHPGEDAHLIVRPSGEYLASPGGARSLAFRAGGEVHGFEQLDLTLNKPDVVLKALGFASPAVLEAHAAARAFRRKRAGLDGEGAPPESFPTADFAEHPAPVVKERKLKLHVHARSGVGGPELAAIEVHADAVPAATIALAARRTREVTEEIELELLPGRNTIEVLARDTRGVESRRRARAVILDAPPAASALRVLAIGVSKYKRPELDLEYAAKDAGDVARFFRASRGAYSGVEAHVLTDGAATREAILAERAFVSAARPEDSLIVYLAGHGFLSRDLAYYFGTSDIAPDAPDARGLAFGDVETLLTASPARKKLLILDTCHSGEVDPALTNVALPEGVKRRGLKRTATAPVPASWSPRLQDFFANLDRGSGATVITSASGLELAVETAEHRNGVFTHVLLRGLETGDADLDGNGGVEVGELRSYTKARVEALTGGLQHPSARHVNTQVDFAVHERGRTFRGHTDAVVSVAFDPAGRTVYASDAKGAILAWNTASGASRPLREVYLDLVAGGALAVDPSGRWLAHATHPISNLAPGVRAPAPPSIEIWSLLEGRRVAQVPLEDLWGAADLTFTSGLAAAVSEKVLGFQEATWAPAGAVPIEGPVWRIAAGPEGRAAVEGGGAVRIVDTRTGAAISELAVKGRVTAVAGSASLLAYTTRDAIHAHRWDGTAAGELALGGVKALDLAISREGDVAIAGEDGTVRVHFAPFGR